MPDNRTLLTGGADRMVRRWDAVTGEHIGAVAMGAPEDPLAAYAGDRGAEVYPRLHRLPHAVARRRQSRRADAAREFSAAGSRRLPGYNFSDALKKLDIVWTPETVSKLFEVGPMAYTPGTKMPEQHIGSAEGPQGAGGFPAEGDEEIAKLARIFALRRSPFFALAQIVLGRARVGPRRRAVGIEVLLGHRDHAAVLAHLDDVEALRRVLNIQCLPSSLAVTRSIVLFTPNGLPQRMQQNGSSCLITRADAVAARKSSCGFSLMTFSGQVALHSPHCTQASSAKRSVGFSGSSQRAGRAGRDAGQAQRAAFDIDLDRAEWRAGR